MSAPRRAAEGLRHFASSSFPPSPHRSSRIRKRRRRQAAARSLVEMMRLGLNTLSNSRDFSPSAALSVSSAFGSSSSSSSSLFSPGMFSSSASLSSSSVSSSVSVSSPVFAPCTLTPPPSNVCVSSSLSSSVESRLQASADRFLWRRSSESVPGGLSGSSSSSIASAILNDGFYCDSGNALFCDSTSSYLSYLLSAGECADDWSPYVSKLEATALVASQVSLPQQAATASLLDLLPPAVSAQWASASGGMVVDGAPVSAGPKPACFASRHEYLLLVDRMLRAGMLSFTTAPKCVNGLFCLPKEPGVLRLIVDARPANSLFVPPAPVELPGPDLVSQLSAAPGSELFVGKIDVSDFYHRLTLPDWMVPYFALPAVSTADFPSLVSKFGPSALVFPCLRTLPMGFSHAVSLAQAAHMNLLATTTRVDTDDCICNASDTRLNRVRFMAYIDDFVVVGTSRQAVQALLDRHKRALERAGLPSKPSKEVQATSSPVEILGVELYGRRSRFGLSPLKMRNLCRATLVLCRSRVCTSLQLAHVVGRWTWAMLVKRPCLSIFQAVYKFIAAGFVRPRRLWNAAVRELELAAMLAPLMWVSLDAAVADVVVTSDASSSGMGVVYASVARADVEPLVLVSSGSARSVEQRVPALPLLDHGDERGLPLSLARARWRTAVSSPWRNTLSHINVLEAVACRTALRWLLSRPAYAFGSRVLFLGDSLVVTGALAKGRSSSFALLAQLRRIAALLIATGTQMVARWVPSHLNPSDAASRNF